MVLFHRAQNAGQNASQSFAKVSYVVSQIELGSPEIPMTRFPPLLPTGSALYFVAVKSISPVPEAAGEPEAGAADSDPAAVLGAAADVEGDDAVVPHADAMIALVAIRANKRFRIELSPPKRCPSSSPDPCVGSFRGAIGGRIGCLKEDTLPWSTQNEREPV